ncbi:hypothetical protein GCM10011609_20170 [Lentzea pudingi]|uniref:Uncharacterized protein n=1 Tax=Lentzea pudingi TaxID=1789439 RepID=A0ABQ2HLT5_9PSEU|nr:hypothetical protein [Lentzea pudingi]GGM84041.1 hypothetical protein GCM10011609_20170 [Lentzea pudingi]
MTAKKYRYYALTGYQYTLENPFTVVRVGGEFPEGFTTALEWDRTDLLDRIRTGRDGYEVVEVGEEDAKRFETTQARRVAEARERDGGGA